MGGGNHEKLIGNLQFIKRQLVSFLIASTLIVIHILVWDSVSLIFISCIGVYSYGWRKPWNGHRKLGGLISNGIHFNSHPLLGLRYNILNYYLYSTVALWLWSTGVCTYGWRKPWKALRNPLIQSAIVSFSSNWTRHSHRKLGLRYYNFTVGCPILVKWCVNLVIYLFR